MASEPQIVIGRARDAGRIQVDQESGHAARAGAVRVGARHGQHAVGMGGHGNRRLLAVDHPVAAVAPGAQLQVGGVGAAARLGKPERNRFAAFGDGRQPRRRQRLVGMAGEDVGAERGEQRHIGDIEVAIGDLLDQQAGGHAVDAHAAITFRQGGRDKAEAAHFPNERAADRRVLLALAVAGQQHFAGEAAGGLAEGGLVFCQSELHGALRSRWRI